MIRLYDTSNGQFRPMKGVHARNVGWSVLDVALSPDSRHLIYTSWCDYSESNLCTGWGGHLFRRFHKHFFWEFPRLLGCTAATMLPKQARRTFRKHITKVAAPDGSFYSLTLKKITNHHSISRFKGQLRGKPI